MNKVRTNMGYIYCPYCGELIDNGCDCKRIIKEDLQCISHLGDYDDTVDYIDYCNFKDEYGFEYKDKYGREY